MACGRFGFLVRLIDLMAVVQKRNRKVKPSTRLCIGRRGCCGEVEKTEFIFTYLLLLDEHRLKFMIFFKMGLIYTYESRSDFGMKIRDNIAVVIADGVEC